MPSPEQREGPGRRRLVEAAVLAAVVLLLAWCLIWSVELAGRRGGAAPAGQRGSGAPGWALAVDDAYIFVRYAQQAARGRPLQWSDGEPSSGASSFLYPVLLLPGQWLFDGLEGWSRWSRWVGVAGLWLAGLAALRLLRRVGVPEPWPLAGGLAVVLSGPIAVVSIGGMESAWNAAAVLLACSLWPRPGEEPEPRRRRGLLAVLALLPLVRPENLGLTALAAAALAWRPPAGFRRRHAGLVLLPALGLLALYAALTGEAQPTAAIGKSVFGIAFAEPITAARVYAATALRRVAPIYAGLDPIAWPPLGPLAAATAAAAAWHALRRRSRPAAPDRPAVGRLLPVAVAWAALVAAAPLSNIPLWQLMRHHHSGLACAWVLAVAGAGLGLEAVRRRRGGGRSWHRVAFAVPLLLVLGWPYWAGVYAGWVHELYWRHEPAAGWLARHAGGRVLVVNDAGVPALAHDGPLIDVIGLGTPVFARVHRHGSGALVEELARRRPLPELAAANLDAFGVPEILGRPLLDGLDPERQTLVTEVRSQALAAARLDGAGVDFAYLRDERAHAVRWLPPPPSLDASFAPELAAPPDGRPSLQGCRPVPGRLALALPPEVRAVRLTAALVPRVGVDAGRVLLRAGSKRRAGEEVLGELQLSSDAWSVGTFELGGPTPHLWLESRDGIACVESLAFVGGS